MFRIPKVAELRMKKLVYVSGLVNTSTSVRDGVTDIDQPWMI